LGVSQTGAPAVEGFVLSCDVGEDVAPVSEVEDLLSVLPSQRQSEVSELGQVEEGREIGVEQAGAGQR